MENEARREVREIRKDERRFGERPSRRRISSGTRVPKADDNTELRNLERQRRELGRRYKAFQIRGRPPQRYTHFVAGGDPGDPETLIVAFVTEKTAQKCGSKKGEFVTLNGVITATAAHAFGKPDDSRQASVMYGTLSVAEVNGVRVTTAEVVAVDISDRDKSAEKTPAHGTFILDLCEPQEAEPGRASAG